ncbi:MULTISPECIES: hypothetical protein [Methanobacterium]|jgi:hypothetical protein|uniref:DUF2769 domain-containing protein n=1 Tax=Methanobacterium veterum TaxID=408577 RepID=A0A9E5DM08_9EURY|nr:MULTISPECIES: hypothetical protein [Methanobacterium]MCZ3365891.1 hypothetical protein [Methanobacterium veterum]MCZ3371356.1 hypothetical protein [Methanobacterium veterum]
MNNDRIVPDTEENAARCRCPDCPAYNECIKKENLSSVPGAVQNVKSTKEDAYVCTVPMK